MRNICIVTNYNYAKYLVDSLSALEKQTYPFDEVIIIDDGSTDESVELIREFCARNDQWRMLKKENGGQLSCFNQITHLVSPSDLIFFLDSDDIYSSDYLELFLQHIDTKVDFYFSEVHYFNSENELPLISALISKNTDFLFPSTSAITRAARCWIGNPTSTIALRSKVLEMILPYAFESDWKTRADDVLVFGSSIVGVSKKFIPSLAISYRVHGNNNFHGKSLSFHDQLVRNQRLERLFNVMSSRSCISLMPKLSDVLMEYHQIPQKFRRRFYVPVLFRLLFPSLAGLIKFIGLRNSSMVS